MNKRINFTLCTKTDKNIKNDVCTFMGVRTKNTCYCVLDGKVCTPFCDSKKSNDDLIIEILDEMEDFEEDLDLDF